MVQCVNASYAYIPPPTDGGETAYQKQEKRVLDAAERSAQSKATLEEETSRYADHSEVCECPRTDREESLRTLNQERDRIKEKIAVFSANSRAAIEFAKKQGGYLTVMCICVDTHVLGSAATAFS